MNKDRPFVDGNDACSMLSSAGIGKIYFIGDSFVRHTYISFVSLLLQDYLYAPLNEEGIKNTECHGRGRFTEKACRTAIFFNVFACNDKVHVIYESTGFAFPLQRHEDGDVIIWGAIGNHPMDFFFGSRHGIMNADVLREEVLTPLCLGTHIVTEIQNKQFAPNWRPVLPVTFLPQDAPNKSAYPRV